MSSRVRVCVCARANDPRDAEHWIRRKKREENNGEENRNENLLEENRLESSSLLQLLEGQEMSFE